MNKKTLTLALIIIGAIVVVKWTAGEVTKTVG